MSLYYIVIFIFMSSKIPRVRASNWSAAELIMFFNQVHDSDVYKTRAIAFRSLDLMVKHVLDALHEKVFYFEPPITQHHFEHNT